MDNFKNLRYPNHLLVGAFSVINCGFFANLRLKL